MSKPNDLIKAVPQLTGWRNRIPAIRQPFGACRVVGNMDALDDGRTLSRRDGYSKVLDLADATDVFSPVHEPGLYVVASGTLSGIADDLTPAALKTGLTDTGFAWTEMANRVLYAGATDAGVILHRTDWAPLRVPVPTGFLAEAGSGGALPEGEYLVAAAYVHVTTGVTGGLIVDNSAVGSGSDGSITLTVDPLDGFLVDFFVSLPNGNEPYWVGQDETTFTLDAIPSTPQSIPPDPDQFEALALPSNILGMAVLNGSLYAAVYDASVDVTVIWRSAPFFLTCFPLAQGFDQIPGKILGMIATRDALVLGTAEAIWLYREQVWTRLTDFGLVPGRSIAQDREWNTLLWTTRGACHFAGEFHALQLDKAAVAPGNTCTTAIVEREGLKQFVAVTDGNGQPWSEFRN